MSCEGLKVELSSLGSVTVTTGTNFRLSGVDSDTQGIQGMLLRGDDSIDLQFNSVSNLRFMDTYACCSSLITQNGAGAIPA